MQIVETAFFYILSGFAILAGLGVVFAPRIIYSAVSLLIAFVAIAGVFIMLNADFVGLAQILVYAVGVVIMVIFAIMLTCQKEDKKLWIAFAPRTILSLGFALCLFLIIISSLSASFTKTSDKTGYFKVQAPTIQEVKVIKEEGTAKILGTGIFTKYVLPFEVLSVLLLVLTIGAVMLAKRNSNNLLNPTTVDIKEQEDV